MIETMLDRARMFLSRWAWTLPWDMPEKIAEFAAIEVARSVAEKDAEIARLKSELAKHGEHHQEHGLRRPHRWDWVWDVATGHAMEVKFLGDDQFYAVARSGMQGWYFYRDHGRKWSHEPLRRPHEHPCCRGGWGFRLVE